MWKIFRKEGDDFVDKLIEIVKKEKIKITQFSGSRTNFKIDDDTYLSDIDDNGCRLKVYYNHELKSDVEISKKKYYWFYKEYNRQKKQKFIDNLPDLSEVGRAAKKYKI